jgi:hypothetical protein
METEIKEFLTVNLSVWSSHFLFVSLNILLSNFVEHSYCVIFPQLEAKFHTQLGH